LTRSVAAALQVVEGRRWWTVVLLLPLPAVGAADRTPTAGRNELVAAIMLATRYQTRLVAAWIASS